MHKSTLYNLCDNSWFNQIYLVDKKYPHCFTDKYYIHSYIPIYDNLFETFKDSHIKLLEIGVEQGGSLKLWHDYFSKADIYGVDINTVPDWLNEFDRIKTFNIDAYKKENLYIYNNLYFDIIIDDGPHTLESMKFCARYYSNILVKNGLLIIEDIPVYEWIEEILKEIPENILFNYQIFDLRDKKYRHNDIMLCILKT